MNSFRKYMFRAGALAIFVSVCILLSHSTLAQERSGKELLNLAKQERNTEYRLSATIKALQVGTELTTIDSLTGFLECARLFSNLGYSDSSEVYFKKAEALAVVARPESEQLAYKEAIYDFLEETNQVGVAVLKLKELESLYSAKNDTLNLGLTRLRLANLAFQQNNYIQAKDEYWRAYRNFALLGSLERQVEATLAIGDCFNRLSDYPQAEDRYNHALTLLDNDDFPALKARAYSSLGNLNLRTGSIDLAIKFLNLAVDIRNDLKDNLGLGENYMDFGDLFMTIGNVPRAESYYKQSEEALAMTGDRVLLSELYLRMGKLYYGLQDYEQSRHYLGKCVNLSTSLEAGLTAMEAYNELSKAVYQLGQFEQAYHYLKLAKLMNDSLIDMDVDQRMNELRLKYETENTRRNLVELNRLTDEKKQEERTTLFLFIFPGVILIAVLVIYRLYRQSKSREEKLIQLSEQKAEEASELQQKLVDLRMRTTDSLVMRDNLLTQLESGVIGPLERAELGALNQEDRDRLIADLSKQFELIESLIDLEVDGTEISFVPIETSRFLTDLSESFDAAEINCSITANELPEVIFSDESLLSSLLFYFAKGVSGLVSGEELDLSLSVTNSERGLAGEFYTIRFDLTLKNKDDFPETLFNSDLQDQNPILTLPTGIPIEFIPATRILPLLNGIPTKDFGDSLDTYSHEIRLAGKPGISGRQFMHAHRDQIDVSENQISLSIDVNNQSDKAFILKSLPNQFKISEQGDLILKEQADSSQAIAGYKVSLRNTSTDSDSEVLPLNFSKRQLIRALESVSQQITS